MEEDYQDYPDYSDYPLPADDYEERPKRRRRRKNAAAGDVSVWSFIWWLCLLFRWGCRL